MAAVTTHRHGGDLGSGEHAVRVDGGHEDGEDGGGCGEGGGEHVDGELQPVGDTFARGNWESGEQ